MKIEINPKQTEFEPIIIKLTVESKDELAELYARFNNNYNVIECSPQYYPLNSNRHCRGVFNKIEQLCESLLK